MKTTSEPRKCTAKKAGERLRSLTDARLQTGAPANPNISVRHPAVHELLPLHKASFQPRSMVFRCTRLYVVVPTNGCIYNRQSPVLYMAIQCTHSHTPVDGNAVISVHVDTLCTIPPDFQGDRSLSHTPLFLNACPCTHCPRVWTHVKLTWIRVHAHTRRRYSIIYTILTLISPFPESAKLFIDQTRAHQRVVGRERRQRVANVSGWCNPGWVSPHCKCYKIKKFQLTIPFQSDHEGFKSSRLDSYS